MFWMFLDSLTKNFTQKPVFAARQFSPQEFGIDFRERVIKLHAPHLILFGQSGSKWLYLFTIMLETLTPTHIAGTEECQLSEGPLWNSESNFLFWTDITAGKIHRFDASTEQHKVIYQGEPVGGFTFQENGELLLFRVNDIALLKPDGRISKVRDFSDKGMNRFNDVIADPRGRVFAGTTGPNPDAGLYRMDLNGEITKLFSGTACSNGMGFSPDQKKFYWTNTTTRQIFEFEYEAGSGEISGRRVFYDATSDEGVPDGLAVDSQGCVWSARWGGSSVVRHAPDGKVLGRIRFPAVNVSSICFGGTNLDELFVTAAQNVQDTAPHVRGLFRVRTRFRGSKEFRSRIQVES